jgi:hypothetical protein
MKRVFNTLLYCLILAHPACTGVDEGSTILYTGPARVAAARPEYYAAALEAWRPLAQQDNAKAQLNLGLLYVKGHGVPQDYREAVWWFSEAAKQGNGQAQFYLGMLYANGHGVPKNDATAAQWYRRAASRGHKGVQPDLYV